MRVRALDINGDWTFGKGQNDYKTGLDALIQEIQTKVLCFLGDCFFDLATGLDWFSLLGGKDQVALNLAVSARILNVEGVTGVKNVSVNLESTSRNITVTYQVQSVFGPVNETFQYDLNGTV